MKNHSGPTSPSEAGKGKGMHQSGSHSQKHAMPSRGTPMVGPGARPGTRREGNTDNPPTNSGTPASGRSHDVHASGGKKAPGVQYGYRGGGY